MSKGSHPWEQGHIQVYTGDGKGKTTAALGLALRAAGAGARVFIAQFAKGRPTAELDSLARLSDLVTIKQYGRGRFIVGEPEPEDIEAAQQGLEEAQKVITSGEYSLVILDEANVAVDLGLLSVGALLSAVNAKPEHVEIVITGRNAHKRIIDRADLVTEMREVKHYHSKGVKARRGIEK
ncbi:MAG: cob(I)yrinic acid a,c-diamide adenosyltransferase [Armatimonadetes bacterium]|nr:cob(I)yrinic acid a,c-diamide adenosyltransferase [Armatimonadota bacterium]